MSSITTKMLNDLDAILSQAEELYQKGFKTECFMHLEDEFISEYKQYILFDSFDNNKDIFSDAGSYDLFTLEQCLIEELNALHVYCIQNNHSSQLRQIEEYKYILLLEDARPKLYSFNIYNFDEYVTCLFQKLFILIRLFNLLNK